MLTVYTALFGDDRRDVLRPPPHACTARYVCFTDQAIAARGWTIERVDGRGLSPTALARQFKARPDHWIGAGVDTVWIDASCELTVPAAAIVRAATAPIMGLRHPDRDTVEREAQVIVSMRLTPAAVVQAQLAVYRAAGFPTDVGPLTTTGLLVRLPGTAAFNALWDEQLQRYSLRDQLSIDYCAWATATPIGHLPGSYRDNAFMRYHRHARLAS